MLVVEAEPEGPGRTDRALAVALFVVALAAYAATRRLAGLWGHIGSDAPLWGLTAMDLRVGAPPQVPPAYPALLGLVERLGPDLVGSGVAVSMAAAAAVPAAVLLAARHGGATRRAALLAALAALACPDLGAWAQQLQPDSLTALGAVLLAGALAASASRGRSTWLVVAVAALLPLVREHGAVLALVALAVLGLRARRLSALPPVLGLLLALWLVPILGGQAPGLNPFRATWSSRTDGAVSVLAEGERQDASYARQLPARKRQAYRRLVAEGDRARLLRWHAARSLGLAPDGWLLLGGAAGLALLGRRRRTLALAAPLAAALPALVVWSQRRHVMVLIPVALAVLAAARPLRRRDLAAVAAAALLIAAAWPWPTQWRTQLEKERTERIRAETVAGVGRWICEQAPPGSFLGGYIQEVGLYCPLPHHDPDGSAADWLTWVVAAEPPPGLDPARWQLVHDARGVRVYRLEPAREPRPCEGARAAPTSRYLAPTVVHAAVEGCAEPAAH